MTKISIEVPFSGFYESWHDDAIDRALSSYFEDDHGELDQASADAIYEADVDWQAIQREYAEAYVEAFATEFDLDLELEDLTSPREYNFATDRLFCKINKTKMDEIRKEVEAYTEWRETIKERFTSYSGFSSNYSADIDSADWTADKLDECQYMVILETWIEHNGKANHVEFEEWQLIEDIEFYGMTSIETAVDKINDYKIKAKEEAKQ